MEREVLKPFSMEMETALEMFRLCGWNVNDRASLDFFKLNVPGVGTWQVVNSGEGFKDLLRIMHHAKRQKAKNGPR